MPRSRRGPPKGANSSVAGAAPRGGRVSGLNQAYNRMAKASRVPNPLATPTTHQGELPGRRVEVKELKF
uniref:OSJNBa0029H02.11 protein n=1 Tax=Oryza sativa subsp. japonica TaxID=39947 RepID=Q7XT78_ORYSJ|nr:OSJNBa0029H02.11 [Oryza sativa Japonica Group]